MFQAWFLLVFSSPLHGLWFSLLTSQSPGGIASLAHVGESHVVGKAEATAVSAGTREGDSQSQQMCAPAGGYLEAGSL